MDVAHCQAQERMAECKIRLAKHLSAPITKESEDTYISPFLIGLPALAADNQCDTTWRCGRFKLFYDGASWALFIWYHACVQPKEVWTSLIHSIQSFTHVGSNIHYLIFLFAPIETRPMQVL